MEGTAADIPGRVRREALLRYAGYGNQPIGADLEARIEGAATLCGQVAAPRACWRTFPVADTPDGLVLEGSILRIPDGCGPEGLRRACSMTVGALTLGASIDRALAQLGCSDSVAAVLLDAAASALIEDCADAWERALDSKAAAAGLHPGQRLSPGYGGLPLELSAAIAAVLDAPRAIGLHSLAHGLLQPQKSLTVLVPLFRSAADARTLRYSCDNCRCFEGCPFRERGTTCYGR